MGGANYNTSTIPSPMTMGTHWFSDIIWSELLFSKKVIK